MYISCAVGGGSSTLGGSGAMPPPKRKFRPHKSVSEAIRDHHTMVISDGHKNDVL